MVTKEVLVKTTTEISRGYISLMGDLGKVGQFLNILLLVVIVVLYSVFIWKLYRFISRKDFLQLDLNKYNTSDHAVYTHLIAGSLYLLEYIIISPFLIFFWFAVFAVFLIIMTQGNSILTILTVSTIIVSAIRITSYYDEDLSKELAKLLPLTLLAISLITPTFFQSGRIINELNRLPEFFGNIIFYLVFIFILETILRFLDFVMSLLGTGK